MFPVKCVGLVVWLTNTLHVYCICDHFVHCIALNQGLVETTTGRTVDLDGWWDVCSWKIWFGESVQSVVLDSSLTHASINGFMFIPSVFQCFSHSVCLVFFSPCSSQQWTVQCVFLKCLKKHLTVLCVHPACVYSHFTTFYFMFLRDHHIYHSCFPPHLINSWLVMDCECF